ncbi:hypothetical protein [Dactylosporangium cerinum]
MQLAERPPERPVPDAADTVTTALAVQAALAKLAPGSGRCWCCGTSRT